MRQAASSDDFFICVRTIGERTEKCLLERIKEEFPSASMGIASAFPSSKTLEKAFRMAMESGKKWTINLDADLLLMPGALQKMFNSLNELQEQVFAVRFLIADPLLGTIRFAGNQSYRIEYIPLALPFVIKAQDKLRPDRYVIEQMEAKGFLFADEKRDVIALHDAEQYYRDIYRKCFVYSFKHLNKVEEFLPYWRADESNLDFKVARKGFADGVQYCRQIHIDVRLMDEFKNDFEKWMEREGFSEKEPLLSYPIDCMPAVVHSAMANYFAYLKKKKSHTFY